MPSTRRTFGCNGDPQNSTHVQLRELLLPAVLEDPPHLRIVPRVRRGAPPLALAHHSDACKGGPSGGEDHFLNAAAVRKHPSCREGVSVGSVGLDDGDGVQTFEPPGPSDDRFQEVRDAVGPMADSERLELAELPPGVRICSPGNELGYLSRWTR